MKKESEITLEQLSEVVAAFSVDDDKINSLINFYGDTGKSKTFIFSEKNQKDCYKCQQDIEKELEKNGSIRAEGLSAHYICQIPNFKINNINESYKDKFTYSLSYWMLTQKLILENDEHIYSFVLSYYLFLGVKSTGAVLAVPILISQKETRSFGLLQDWVFNLKNSLPPHNITPLNITNYKNDSEIMTSVLKAYEHQLADWGVKMVIF